MGQLQGDLSVMPLADLIIWFANRSLNGVLNVERGTQTKQFIIRRGSAIRAASNDPREYFGQFLIHFGFLTEDQLERAFETQRETQVYLGRILVMIGIVPEEHVIQTLQVKINETLLDAMRWDVGRFIFSDTDTDTEHERPEIEVVVSLMDIHREAARRTTMWEQYNKVFTTQYMTLAVNDSRVPPGLTMDKLDGRILALARHGMTIEGVTLELHATDYQVAARLYELYRLGILEPREPSDSIRSADITPPGEMTHVDAALNAMAKQDYANALRHVNASARLDPGNEGLNELVEQIEGKFREHLQHEILSREAVPVLLRKPDEQEKKKLGPKQKYILARIDGRRTIQAIIQVSPMRDVEALDIIRSFKRDGLIEI